MGEKREKDSWDETVALYQRDVDLSLLLENLKLSHAQRLEKFVNFMRFAEELRESGNKAKKIPAS